jgi:hypothetical protein
MNPRPLLAGVRRRSLGAESPTGPARDDDDERNCESQNGRRHGEGRKVPESARAGKLSFAGRLGRIAGAGDGHGPTNCSQNTTSPCRFATKETPPSWETTMARPAG